MSDVIKPGVLQMGALPPFDQQALDDNFGVKKLFEAKDKHAFLTAHGRGTRAISTRGDIGVSTDVIDACPDLELIAIYGVGYDAIDMERCRERGITVTNTPGVLNGDVADLGVAMMLSHARGIIGAQSWVISRKWETAGAYPLMRRVHKARVGILGLGRIGFDVAKRLAAFEMDIAYSATAPKSHAADWKFIPDATDLAEHSDYLFVTLAASAATRHIVNKDVLEVLGPDGMIINISRAANIDEDAMLTALENKKLGYAALDVFENEPAINPRFLKLDNVLLQPHAASGTFETRKDMGQMMRENLAAHFAGDPLISPVENA